MMALRLLDQIVQNPEVIVILGEAESAIRDCMSQMNRVRCTAHADVHGHLNVMRCFAEQLRQQR
jgi:hypothetical protein